MSIDDTQFDGMDWIRAELEDSLDEDFELELSEPALSMELRKIYKRKHPETLDRVTYFKSLLTLQATETLRTVRPLLDSSSPVLIHSSAQST